jgi:parallel beta-helix repeat protein
MRSRWNTSTRAWSFTLLGWLCADGALAAPGPCSEAKLAEVRAPAEPGTGAALIDCHLDLVPGEVITKSLYFNLGEVSNDVVVDCHGAALSSNASNAALPRVNVQSHFDAGTGRWARPSNILVRNCHLLGNLNVNGIGGAAHETVQQSSRTNPDHSALMWDSAPTGIVFDGLVVETQARIGAYLNVGATGVTIRNSEFRGSSNSTVIYLEAESGWHQILDNHFHTVAAREVIAVDGSTENMIRGNTFHATRLGGIYLYRNCGESGTVRHANPQKNDLEGNMFLDASGPLNGFPHIFVASRNGNRNYCEDDAGYPYGSSVSNLDHAQFTEARGNYFEALSGARSKAVMLNAGPSYLVDNRSNLPSAIPADDAWGSFFGRNGQGEEPDTASSCFYRDGLPILIQSGEFHDLDLSSPTQARCAATETSCQDGTCTRDRAVAWMHRSCPPPSVAPAGDRPSRAAKASNARWGYRSER